MYIILIYKFNIIFVDLSRTVLQTQHNQFNALHLNHISNNIQIELLEPISDGVLIQRLVIIFH